MRVEGLIASRQFEAAAAAVADLQTRWPGQADVAQLRGRLQLAQHDLAEARTAFEQALTLAPDHTPATLALAALDAQSGQPAQAAARLQALLKNHPEDAEASLALAALLGSGGSSGSERVGPLLADALRSHPGDVRLRLAYARHLQRQGQGPAALVVLQEGATAMTGNADLLEALAGQQLRERAFGQALLTLNKLVPLRPDAIEPWLRTAEAQVGLGATAAARLALQRALALQPGSLQAQRGLISLALLDKQPQAALALARQIQQQRGALAVGLALEGDVQVTTGNTAGAAAVYLDGLRRAPSTEFAAKAHAALLALGRSGAAAAVAADWRRSHPRDADFAMHLGNGALARGDAATAEREFQQAVRLQPLHALALNNLATAMLQLRHTGALPYAKRAAALMPDSPEVRDTLAAASAQIP
jgi:putative PEP-CTERM system TPR-repeat lipoprotein